MNNTSIPEGRQQHGFSASAVHEVQAVSHFLKPRSIAIIGASNRSRWSNTVFTNLVDGGYSGQIHLVNPKGGVVHGVPALSSCAEIGTGIDLGIIMVPGAAVPEVLGDLINVGTKSAMILTSGFAETGVEGTKLQNRAATIAREGGLRLLGPNSLGYVNFIDKIWAWGSPVRAPSKSGGVAIISQSGATAYFFSTLAHQQDVGLSHIVATGNEIDFDCCSFMEYFIDDPKTHSIALFIESVREPKRFIQAAERALRAAKPIVVLKVGASDVTAKSAAAHTGALVGDDRVFDGICRQFGITRVGSLEELLATADIMGQTGVLPPGGLALVSNSGGICEIAADAASAHGIDLPELSPATANKLGTMLPSYATPHNPLDLTGGIDPAQCENLIRALGDQPNVAVVLCPYYEIPTSQDQRSERLTQLHDHLSRGLNGIPVPGILVSYTNTNVNDLSRSIIAEFEAPYMACGLDRAIAGLAGAFRWSEKQRDFTSSRRHSLPEHDRANAERPCSEGEALSFLARQGVPVVSTTLALNEEEAMTAARRIGDRVVLKIASPDIAHKSDIGGVVLNIEGDEAVATAYNKVVAAARSQMPDAYIEGVLVAPMRQRGIEVFAGVSRDSQWGSVLAVGMGGIWVEIFQDVALRLLPVEIDEVRRMLLELRGASLFMGQRGIPAANLDTLAAAIAAIGNAALSLGSDLAALDVNPLWVHGDQVEALDALFIWNTDSQAAAINNTVAPGRHQTNTKPRQ